MTDQPNVIVVMCDQFRAFAAGCYGNDFCKTPNIDRLASQGVRFDIGVSPNPVCTPARACTMTGQYSRTCQGDPTNPLAPFAQPDGTRLCSPWPVWERKQCTDPTLPEQLRDAGYDTALIGKWHIDPAPELLGFDYRLYPRVNHRHTDQVFIDQWPPGEVVHGFSVDHEIAKVGEYLAADRDKPFFMYYNISPPHMPVGDMPEKYLTMYAPEDVPLRENVFIDGAMYHDESIFLVYLWDYLYYWYKLSDKCVLPEGFDLRHLTALYYGAVTWVDDTIGTLMEHLEATGHAEDTIIVFTADHGDNLGSHHLWNKQELIEESIRVPMIYWAPERWAPAVNTGQVASLVDIMPTVLETCGVAPHADVEGQSLAPILEGTRDAMDDPSAIIETSGLHVGVRTPTHMYGILLEEDWTTVDDDAHQFFDLRSDPLEMNNLARTDEQADLAAELKAKVLDWHAGTPRKVIDDE